MTESLKYPTEKNTHARERIWHQISGKDAEYWTNEKKPNHLLPSEKKLKERKCSSNSLLGLAVNSSYVVIINTSYLSN